MGRDAKGHALPDASDDWLITEADDTRLKIQNVRTGHETVLAKDHIHHYTSNPHRVTNGREHAFLTLLVLQLQMAVAEGAGGFNPLKTGPNLGAFRPGSKPSEQIQL